MPSMKGVPLLVNSGVCGFDKCICVISTVRGFFSFYLQD